MENRAGKPFQENDIVLRRELEMAGIEVTDMASFRGGKECFFEHQEVKTNIAGECCGWVFKRLWYYWAAEGPGLNYSDAVALWETSQKENLHIRVNGDCTDPHPFKETKGLGVNTYHIDTLEGLKLFASTLKAVTERAKLEYQTENKG